MKFIRKSRHALLMAVGCVAMLFAVLTLTTEMSGGRWGVYLLLLLCPAMHLLMHRGMHGSEKRQEMPPPQLPAPQEETSGGDRNDLRIDNVK